MIHSWQEMIGGNKPKFLTLSLCLFLYCISFNSFLCRVTISSIVSLIMVSPSSFSREAILLAGEVLKAAVFIFDLIGCAPLLFFWFLDFSSSSSPCHFPLLVKQCLLLVAQEVLGLQSPKEQLKTVPMW
jgi:hypothetical protein